MSSKRRLFYLSIFASIAFFLMINIGQPQWENFLVEKNLQNTSQSQLLAYTLAGNSFPEPRGANVSTLEKSIPQPAGCVLSAKAALSMEILPNNSSKIIFEKNSQEKLLIASITKLMTSVVAVEFLPQNFPIKVSELAVAQEDNTGLLEPGDILTIGQLMYSALIESSNDAAFALTEPITEKGFVALMNLKAQSLKMENTLFSNPTGLDEQTTNYSTAQDLAILAKYIAKKPEIMEIISQKEYPLYLDSGILHHNLINTNELLGEIPEILGGKTGYTEKAGECLLTLSKTKQANVLRIDIVLGSTDRFGDTRKLLECSSFQ